MRQLRDLLNDVVPLRVISNDLSEDQLGLSKLARTAMLVSEIDRLLKGHFGHRR
jgi:hypothetical protein